MRHSWAVAAVAAVAAVVLLAAAVAAVDRNNFRPCSKASFCRRNRALAEGQSPYEVDKNTIKSEGNAVSFELRNTLTQTILVVDIITYASDTARLRITEKNPKHPRYQVVDVISNNLQPAAATVTRSDPQAFLVTFNNNLSLAVSYQPFHIDVSRGTELLLRLNNRGLLNFESYRDRLEDEEEGTWAETFLTHHDSKPRGPASVGIDVSFAGVNHVYGIPEHADSFDLRNTRDTPESEPYRLFNLDVFEYELDERMALYGSIPYMLGHSPKHTTGVFFLNSAEMWIDIRKTSVSRVSSLLHKIKSIFASEGGEQQMPQTDTHWFAESGIIDLFMFLGPTPKDVFAEYAIATSTAPLPPLFSLAYHQCRWNYNDQEDVLFVDRKLDEHEFPMDVMWLDIEHSDGKRWMTWDGAKFPDPAAMQRALATKGRRMVTIVDPHIKRANDYYVHEQAERLGYYIKDKDGKNYDGWCWPGSSSWVDFTNPEARNWWASLFALDVYKGSTEHLFTWNDMNEPSVFNGPEISMHRDCLHYGGWEHRDVHNAYGMWQQAATAMGQLRRSGNKERPFVLSRAFFAGSQRFGAVWTGDNKADWGHLAVSIPMLLSMSVVGLPFVGADMGGFFGNPDAELTVRWYQAGAYQPFVRAHAHLDTKRREPYLFDQDSMSHMRSAIRKRYELLPYWYTLFFQGYRTGTPPMRPIWAEFPDETSTFSEQTQYMAGNALLVAPALKPGQQSVSVYLPGSEPWYEADTATMRRSGSHLSVDAPINRVPVFQRGGTIVPRKMRVRRSSSLMSRDPFTLTVALDSNRRANGQLYVDDYHSMDYQQGTYLVQDFFIEPAASSGGSLLFNSRPAPASGAKGHSTVEWLERIVLMGMNSAPTRIWRQAGAATAANFSKQEQVEFVFNTATKVLEIKKPWAKSIGEDFTLLIEA